MTSHPGMLTITYGCGQKEIEGPWVGLSGIRGNSVTSCLNNSVGQ